ncbi:MAG: helix-turn-helix transcriptional regulator [Rhodospirillaceae bacterium]|nr:helix-turn-helix transcriptional regulator [Rhodospirillaceae bacterium]MBT5667159.1 helix-turn-helix transcriptional regulator [Rhodospirillaceae bacterium]
MTPFGVKLREMRAAKGATMKDMAKALLVSPAYLSALEHGKRGRPSRAFLYDVCTYFNIIWDEAEELERLAQLSHPRAVVDTAGLSADATELANRLAETIVDLPDEAIQRMLAEVRAPTK